MLAMLGASAINLSLMGLCYLRGRSRNKREEAGDKVEEMFEKRPGKAAHAPKSRAVPASPVTPGSSVSTDYSTDVEASEKESKETAKSGRAGRGT